MVVTRHCLHSIVYRISILNDPFHLISSTASFYLHCHMKTIYLQWRNTILVEMIFNLISKIQCNRYTLNQYSILLNVYNQSLCTSYCVQNIYPQCWDTALTLNPKKILWIHFMFTVIWKQYMYMHWSNIILVKVATITYSISFNETVH